MQQVEQDLGDGEASGTLHCSLDGSVLAVDQRLSRILGYGTWQAMMDEVLSLEQLFADPFDRKRIRGRIEDALTGDEARWLTREGTSIWVRMRVHRLPGLGREHAVLQIDVDETTNRRRLEERLRELLDARVLERAASALSHEINQVLTYAIGHAELIAERLPGELRAETDEDLLALRHAILDGARITSRLREVTRTRLVRPEVVDLAAFVATVEPLIRHLLPGDLALECTFDEPGLVYADRAILEEALILMLSAVRDEARAGTVVVIRVARAVSSEPHEEGPGGADPVLLEVRYGRAEARPREDEHTALDAARVRFDEIGGFLRSTERPDGFVALSVGLIGPAPSDPSVAGNIGRPIGVSRPRTGSGTGVPERSPTAEPPHACSPQRARAR